MKTPRFVIVFALAAAGLSAGCFNINVGTRAPSGRGSADTYADSPAPPPSTNLPPVSTTPPPPVPSVPTAPTGGTGGGWVDVVRTVAGGVFLDAENGAVFYAFDTLAHPNKPVELVARLWETKDLRGVAGVTVAFRRGDWTAGRITTDANGVALMRWTPAKAGHYSFQAEVVAVAKSSQRGLLGMKSPLLVAARDKKAPQVVVDLDHTVVDSNFFMVLVGGGKPMAGSIDALNRIAKRYGVIYLTHRPDVLTRKTRSWLSGNGYPAGPLLSAEIKDVLDSGKFKTARLVTLRRDFPGVAIGIGDKLSDAQSYVDNGMSAYLIPHYENDDWEELRETAAEIRALRGQGRLHVVDNWQEIEQGIFGGKTFPSAAYAQKLELRAARVRAQDRDDD